MINCLERSSEHQACGGDVGDVHAWIAARNAEWFDVPLDDQECYWKG